MLNPADIESRDFLVVVHGYHKSEVRAFLAEVAAAHAEVLAQLESEPVADDDFDSLGTGVANILKAARASAAEITGAAEALRSEAAEIRAQSAVDADHLRAEAAAIRADAAREADDLRSEAAIILEDARARADRLEMEATTRARRIEIEAEASVRNRLDAVREREVAIRDRLLELGEELRMAQLTLDGEETVDVRDHIGDTVTADAQ